MHSGIHPEAEATPREERLAALLARYQDLIEQDESAGVGMLREEAGDLFDDLTEAAGMLDTLRLGFGETRDESAIPTEIGPYQVLSRLGEGAFGIVYAAEDSRSGERVAVKVIRGVHASSPYATERFRREIRAAMKVEHPNLIRVLDHGESEGRLYFAMDLIVGVSLRELVGELELDCGELPDRDWLERLDAHGVPALAGARAQSPGEEYGRRMAGLFADLASGLDHAARAGLVHRDIKPANVMIREDGCPLLMDFGLAKLLGEDITSTIAVLGTPSYMSPEQASGDSKQVDVRSDVYGLGGTLYRALTLSYPHPAETFPELLSAILQKTPSAITVFCPQYPRTLATLCARCLEREPVDRYQAAAPLAEDLRRVARGKRPGTGGVSLGRRIRRTAARHRVALGAGAAAAAILVAAILLFTRAAEVVIESLPGGTVTVDGKVRGTSPWSGDLARGKHLLTVARDRFKTHEEQIELGAGERFEKTINLWPEDPFDPELAALVLKSHGMRIGLPKEAAPRPRGLPKVAGEWFETTVVVAPRGTVSRSGLAVALFSLGDQEELHLEVVAPDSRVVHQCSIRVAAGVSLHDLPPAAIREVPDAGACRIRVTRLGAPGEVTAEFALSSEAALPDWLAGSTDTSALVLGATTLLDRGRPGDAFLLLASLMREHPRAPLPLRLALTALVDLGLIEGLAYVELHDRYRTLREGR